MEQYIKNHTDEAHIREIVRWTLDEDLGSGDVTTNWTIPSDANLRGQFLIKAGGVVAGLTVARVVFAQMSSNLIHRTEP